MFDTLVALLKPTSPPRASLQKPQRKIALLLSDENTMVFVKKGAVAKIEQALKMVPFVNLTATECLVREQVAKQLGSGRPQVNHVRNISERGITTWCFLVTYQLDQVPTNVYCGEVHLPDAAMGPIKRARKLFTERYNRGEL